MLVILRIYSINGGRSLWLLVVPAIVPFFYTQECDVLVSAAGQSQTTYKLVTLKLSFVFHIYMEETYENYVLFVLNC